MDFDGAKENIQPLASGRNAERLEVALNAESQRELHEQLAEQCREFERGIDSYVGDDPLELWYEYIQWIEQSYPKSGKETPLMHVISSCLATFENDDRYKQDRRLIKLFIKYVSKNQSFTKYWETIALFLIVGIYSALLVYFCSALVHLKTSVQLAVQKEELCF